MTRPDHAPAPRALEDVLTIDETSDQYPIGRHRLYALCHSGDLRSFRLGRKILIRRVDTIDWFARQAQTRAGWDAAP